MIKSLIDLPKVVQSKLIDICEWLSVSNASYTPFNSASVNVWHECQTCIISPVSTVSSIVQGKFLFTLLLVSDHRPKLLKPDGVSASDHIPGITSHIHDITDHVSDTNRSSIMMPGPWPVKLAIFMTS